MNIPIMRSTQFIHHQRPATGRATSRLRSLASYILLSLLLAMLSACTSKPRLANHSFQFDAPTDSPDIELLNWRYGTSRHPGARGCPEGIEFCPIVGQYVSITGLMRAGDDLYVKWKSRSTNEVFEETVNLRDKLPHDLEDHTIRFIARRSQVYVYLITPTKRIPNPCPKDEKRLALRKSAIPDERVFSLYCSREILRLHPISGIVPTFN